MLELNSIKGTEVSVLGLDDMEPGLFLGVVLEALDHGKLSTYERVIVMRAHQRMASYYQALMYSDMASVADELTHDGVQQHQSDEAAAAEVELALHMTRRAAQVEMCFALSLSRRLPRVAGLLGRGEIDVRRAKVIERGVEHLSDETARRVVDRIADTAGGLTTGELGARLRGEAIDADPGEAAARYRAAIDDRRVVMQPTVAGTANLKGSDLPPDRVQAIQDRIHMIARSLKVGGETRTIDQLCADVFLDLLDGSAHSGASKGAIELRVDVDTLVGLNNRPGELGGYGPVIADIARHIVDTMDDPDLTYTVTTPDGQPVPMAGVVEDRTRRRFTARQQRRIRARDRVCVFPGCRTPGSRSDIDHIEAWVDGGLTTVANGAPLCRHHHRVKHGDGWSYKRLKNGTYQWSTGLGHTYPSGPDPP